MNIAFCEDFISRGWQGFDSLHQINNYFLNLLLWEIFADIQESKSQVFLVESYITIP